MAVYHLPSHLVPGIALAADSVFDLIGISVPVGTKAYILPTDVVRVIVGSFAAKENTRAIHGAVFYKPLSYREIEAIRKEVDRQKLSLLLGDICE